MARVVSPLHSADARGTVAGIQFSRNRSGNFATRRSSGTYPQRGDSVNQRAIMAHAAAAWRDKPPRTQAAWDAHAPYPHTGRQHFIGAAMRLISMQLDPPRHAPLQDPQLSTQSNFRFFYRFPPHVVSVIDWDQDGYPDHWWALHLAPLATYGRPHVRKFKLYAQARASTRRLPFPAELIPNYWAVRLVKVDPQIGLILQELRWTFTADEDHDPLPGQDLPF